MATPTKLQAFGTPAANSNGGMSNGGNTPTCSIGCAPGSCDSNEKCSACDTDYVLVNSKCQPEQYVVEMLFDETTLLLDKTYVTSTSIPDNKWGKDQGNTGNCVTMTSSDTIKLAVSKFPTNMKDFEYHFWIKVDASE